MTAANPRRRPATAAEGVTAVSAKATKEKATPAKEESSGSKSRLNATQRLLLLASTEVVLAKSQAGILMAGQVGKPHLMQPLAGPHPYALVPIALQYFGTYGNPAPRKAFTSAQETLSFEASLLAPREVHLRSARCGSEIWVDTGWDDASVVHVTSNGWTIEPSSPVLFTRSAVTAPLADPRGKKGDLWLIARYVHCQQEDLPLILAVLVTAWFSDVPQPVFSLFGNADSGKSTAMRFLLDLIDPSTTQPGGTLDKDPRNLKAVASVRRVMCFDNASRIDAEMSDLLARISTGGELLSRALYTDDQAHITELLRPVWLNGIMSGFSRGDLASRAVVVELLPVEPQDRLSMEDLNSQWAEERPAIFAGLLTLTVDVLRKRDSMRPTGLHRHAEFERNLLVIDEVLGTHGAERLAEQAGALNEAVLDATTLGMAMRRAVEEARGHHQASLFNTTPQIPRLPGSVGRDDHLFQKHTAAGLMAIVASAVDERHQRDLPQTPKAFGEALSRLTPALRSCLDVEITRPRVSGTRYIMVKDLRA